MGWWSGSAAQQIPDYRPEFPSAATENQYNHDEHDDKFRQPHFVNGHL
jgi:hypothetical protein